MVSGMESKQKTVKKPIAKESIFKTMLYVTFSVASVFLVKNIVSGSLQGGLSVGISLAVFAVIVVLMKRFHAKPEHQQFVVSMSLVFLVFIISLYSGDYYSDDFPLYLAVIGLTGLYLRPGYTKVQMVLADIMLILQYILHPEKAENLSQYILSMAMFTLAALMFYLAIKRGRAFIEISQARAQEAELLLSSMANIGEELQQNFEDSSGRIENLQEANRRLENHTGELEQGSGGITQGAGQMAGTCDNVQERIQQTESQVSLLNDGVKIFETTLTENRKNMEDMNQQMQSVRITMAEANEVFDLLDQQMQEISSVTEQLNRISSSTTMLALNASIEAARAGQQGAGFAVVASKVQELAVDSNHCADQVAGVVGVMQSQIQETSRQLTESTQAVSGSLEALTGLQAGFDRLTEQFQSLYQNIEEQNRNVIQVEAIFEELRQRVIEMNTFSGENQRAVAAIADAIKVYKENISLVLDDSMHVQKLSASMLDISRGKLG